MSDAIERARRGDHAKLNAREVGQIAHNSMSRAENSCDVFSLRVKSESLFICSIRVFNRHRSTAELTTDPHSRQVNAEDQAPTLNETLPSCGLAPSEKTGLTAKQSKQLSPDQTDAGLLPAFFLRAPLDVASRARRAEFISGSGQWNPARWRLDTRLAALRPVLLDARAPDMRLDGRVQLDRPQSKFVLISVYRSFARQNHWKNIPRHPLANDEIELLDYPEGFEAINWALMNTRDYQNAECKSVCMAECLSPSAVLPQDFSRIYVPTEEIEQLCGAKMREINLKVPISVNPGMFR